MGDEAVIDGCRGRSDIMRDWENLYAFSLSFFFLFVSGFLLPCLIFVFSQSRPVDQGVQLEEKRGKQHPRVAAPQPPAIPVFLFSVWGEPPPIAFSCIYSSPTFDLSSNHSL